MKVLLFFILSFALFLRVWQIDQIPPALNWDEVSHGYNAYSILKTGKDEWGIAFPKIFRAYGDYKLPFYVYAVSVSETLFGLRGFSIRFPSVLAGTLSVLFTFLLVRKIWKNENLGFLASLLLAIEPWSLFLSRVAVEANLASFLIIGGFYFLFKGIEKRWFLPFSLLFFGLSLYTYNSARVFTPLILAVFIFLYYSEIKMWLRKEKIIILIGILIFFIFFLPMSIELFSPEGQARYRWVGILDEGAINRINELRNHSVLPHPFQRILYNKLTYFGTHFVKNYLCYFSPNFLFFEGGYHYQFNIPKKGLIYPIQIPFIILGLYALFKRRDKISKLIFAWLLLAPIPASLTRDSPHTLRTILMLPLPQILSALGFWQFLEWIKILKVASFFLFKKVIAGIYLLALFFFLGNFWFAYATSYRTNYSWAWQYGYKEAVSYLKENYQKYNWIYFTKKYGEPHEFVLFYWPWDPQKYLSDPNFKWDYHANWYWVDGFDKFIFVNDWEIKENVKCLPNNKCLLVTSPNNYPGGWKKIKTINFLDGKPAFEIYEF